MALVTLQSPDGSETQCVDDGDLSAYQGWTQVAVGAPLGEKSVLVNGAWDDLPELKARAWEQVKAIRAAKETGTCQTPVGVVQIDEASKAKIMGALDLCKLQEETQQPFSMNFTLADNSRAVLNNTTVRQMAGAAGQYVGKVYDYSWTLRDQINAAADAAALSAIDLNAGWP